MNKDNQINVEKSFEDYLARLQEIVSTLQAGELPLKDSLAIYKEGLDCSKKCHLFLENARKEIEIWQNEELGNSVD